MTPTSTYKERLAAAAELLLPPTPPRKKREGSIFWSKTMSDEIWETFDGYKLNKEVAKDDIKSFFGGGRGQPRAREEDQAGTADSNSQGIRADSTSRVQRTDGKDKHVSKLTKEGTATG